MRTIDKLLHHNLTNKEYEILESRGWINECGGRGSFNFNKIIDRISRCKFFDASKSKTLGSDIKMLCKKNHDLDFSLGGGYKEYWKSNIKFLSDIMELLHWTTTLHRVIILFFIGVPLMVFGVKYFQWGPVKDISFLLDNDNPS